MWLQCQQYSWVRVLREIIARGREARIQRTNRYEPGSVANGIVVPKVGLGVVARRTEKKRPNQEVEACRPRLRKQMHVVELFSVFRFALEEDMHLSITGLSLCEVALPVERGRASGVEM